MKNQKTSSNKKAKSELKELNSQKMNSKSNNVAESKECCKPRNVWKILAISIIAIFAIFIIIGMFRAHYYRPELVKPTTEQTNSAIEITTAQLKSEGVDVSSFKVTTGKFIPKIRHIEFEDDNDTDEKSMLQVSYYNNTVTHMYLVDVDTKQIIVHSMTETFGNVPDPFEMKRNNKTRGFFWTFMPHPIERGENKMLFDGRR